jgi:hemerythrin-like domain-containing protein
MKKHTVLMGFTRLVDFLALYLKELHVGKHELLYFEARIQELKNIIGFSREKPRYGILFLRILLMFEFNGNLKFNAF